MLKLLGHFSYIDKYNRLKFTYIQDEGDDNETKRKLITHCTGTNYPFDDDGFTLCLPKHMKLVPVDIRNKVGLDCVIHVKLTHYSFISKLEANFGTKVEGVQLILDNIRPGTG